MCRRARGHSARNEQPSSVAKPIDATAWWSGEALPAPTLAGSLEGDLADCVREGRWEEGQRVARRLLRADLGSVGRVARFYLEMAWQLFSAGETIPSRRAVALALAIDPAARRELEACFWAADFQHYQPAGFVS